jgi:phospholipid-transporting ATPase
MSQKGIFFRTHNFWSWVGNGFFHSLILYFVSDAIYWRDGVLPDGKIAGHWVWGTSLYTAGLVTVLLKAALITNIWTKYTVIAIPGSLAVWFIFLPVYATVAPKLGFSTEYTNILPIILTDPKFWLMGCVILPMLCLSRDFAWKYAKRMYYPQAYHHVQEIQKYNIQDYRPRYVHLPSSHVIIAMLTFVIQNGTIPKSNSQSPTSTANAQTAWVCFLSN